MVLISVFPLLTKTKFYRAIVIPTLTYAGETLPLTLQEEQRMNTVHMNFLRRLCHLQRLDRVRNSDILERCHCASIQDYLSLARTRWLGHVSRMGDNRWPKHILCGSLASAHTRAHAGRPGTRLWECYQRDLATLTSWSEANHREIMTTGRNRVYWHTIATDGSTPADPSVRSNREVWRDLTYGCWPRELAPSAGLPC